MTRILITLHRRLLHSAWHSTPPPPNDTDSDSEVSKADFEGNLEIVLAALLCALIVAIGLNWIAHCALRRSRPVAAAAAARNGLKKSHLREIPVEIYGSDAGAHMTECSICLGEFLDGERVRVLPKCSHGFHVWCIDKWLALHSSCPNCRHSVVAAADSDLMGNGRQGDHDVVDVVVQGVT